MPRNSIPKRKKINRRKRLLSAKDWVANYEGKKIVKAYSKWFGVDLICAIKELRILNITISEQYEKGIRLSMESERKKKLARKEARSILLNPKQIYGFDYDENFSFIAGFTSNGVPFGLTHEEF